MANFTTNESLYKWSPTDEKAETITEMANNADKIDAKFVEVDNALSEKATNLRVEATEVRITETETDIATLETNLGTTNEQLAEITTVTVENEAAKIGTELVDGTGWTTTGWAGDFTNGFVNTIGQTSPLRRIIPATGTKLYLVRFRVESPSPAGSPNASTDFTVGIGNSVPFVTYKGGGNFDYSFGMKSVSDGDLIFTPGITFNGTIKNISVKEIIGGSNPTHPIKDSTGANVLEFRPTKSVLKNVFIGLNAGMNNIDGDGNVALGDNALPTNTTGYWNTAIGLNALENNTVGSRCIAIGYQALNDNIGGDRNVGIGTFALTANTSGKQNIAIGADCLFRNTTGNDNIAIGMSALVNSTTGLNNIAMGTSALAANVSTNQNIAIGVYSLQKSTTHNNSAVGYNSLANLTTGGNNTALGSNAGRTITTGAGNVFIGYYVGYHANQKVDAANHIAIGNGVYTTANYSLNVGNLLYGDLTGGRLSIGSEITDANTAYTQLQIGNLIKPAAIDVRRNANASGDEIGIYRFFNESNTDIDANTRKYVASMQSKIVTDDANINGNSGADLLFYTKAKGGSYSEKMRIRDNGRVGIGVNPTAYLHLPASSGGLNSAPIKFTAGTLLSTLENGALEFDGTNLFVTVGGVRKTIQVA